MSTPPYCLHFVCMDVAPYRRSDRSWRQIYPAMINLVVLEQVQRRAGSFLPQPARTDRRLPHGEGAHQNNIELGKHGATGAMVGTIPASTALAPGADRRPRHAHRRQGPSRWWRTRCAIARRRATSSSIGFWVGHDDDGGRRRSAAVAMRSNMSRPMSMSRSAAGRLIRRRTRFSTATAGPLTRSRPPAVKADAPPGLPLGRVMIPSKTRLAPNAGADAERLDRRSAMADDAHAVQGAGAS